MIRYGIAGFGLHAVRRLMPGFRLAQQCKVTALSRRDPEKAQASAREYDISHTFTSMEALCRCPEVDVVLVTTPNACHRLDVLTALQLGKPVLCEKPMGMDANQCREMVDAAHRAHLPLGIAHVFRFHESTARIRQRLANHEIGKLVFARSEFSFPGRNHARTWMYDRAIAGGGPISDIGVHCIDSLRFVMDDEVVRVTARTTSDAESRDVEASAILTLQFRKGVLATVLISMRAGYRTPMEFVGESGEIFADDALTVDRPVRINVTREKNVVASEEVSNHLSYAKQVDAFAATVEGHAPFPSPGENGWQNQLILDAAFRSAQSGKTEQVASI